MSSYTTASRTLMLTYLSAHENHAVTAAELRDVLAAQGCLVNITTIYRFLDKLVKDGTALRYASETGDKTLYQYIRTDRGCRDHLHLKCVRCGEVLHLECGFMETIAGHIETDHGFALQCENSILYGLCRRCRECDT